MLAVSVVVGGTQNGGVHKEARRVFAAKVFTHLADCDAAIAGYLNGNSSQRLIVFVYHLACKF